MLVTSELRICRMEEGMRHGIEKDFQVMLCKSECCKKSRNIVNRYHLTYVVRLANSLVECK